MTYQEQAARYADPQGRSRYAMCIREQAHATYANDPDPAIQMLAENVIRGVFGDIDALIAAICAGPNSATLSEDGSLLAAVQASWAGTARAMYGDEV